MACPGLLTQNFAADQKRARDRPVGNSAMVSDSVCIFAVLSMSDGGLRGVIVLFPSGLVVSVTIAS